MALPQAQATSAQPSVFVRVAQGLSAHARAHKQEQHMCSKNADGATYRTAFQKWSEPDKRAVKATFSKRACSTQVAQACCIRNRMRCCSSVLRRDNAAVRLRSKREIANSVGVSRTHKANNCLVVFQDRLDMSKHKQHDRAVYNRTGTLQTLNLFSKNAHSQIKNLCNKPGARNHCTTAAALYLIRTNFSSKSRLIASV